MEALAWQEHYLTGLPQIDDEHRRILELINLLDPDRIEFSPKQLGRTLDELQSFIRRHFDHEQALMEEASYPMIGAHRRLQSVFARRLEEFVARHRAGESIGVELHAMLQRWVVDHIHNDKSYSGQVYTHLRKVDAPRNSGWINRTMKMMFN